MDSPQDVARMFAEAAAHAYGEVQPPAARCKAACRTWPRAAPRTRRGRFSRTCSRRTEASDSSVLLVDMGQLLEDLSLELAQSVTDVLHLD